MARFFKKRNEILGMRPGELVYIGKKSTEKTHLDLITYSMNSLEKKQNPVLSKMKFNRSGEVNWLNVIGVSDSVIMQEFKPMFEIGQLILADIMNTGSRPRYLQTDSGLFLTLKMLSYDNDSEKILSEQLSFFVKENLLITFQEAEGDVFDPVRERLENLNNNIRQKAVDFLTFSLVDSVVDNYIAILQIIAESVEQLEEELLDLPDKNTLNKIIMNKKELIFLSKTVKPLKDAFRQLITNMPDLLKDSEEYFDNLYSSLTHITETIDIYKELLTQHQNTFDTFINNKLNEIMKFLTIFSVIFLPLTLITGIYGTNFDFIPELHFRYGYLFLWGLLGLSVLVMIMVFKKKKWL